MTHDEIDRYTQETRDFFTRKGSDLVLQEIPNLFSNDADGLWRFLEFLDSELSRLKDRRTQIVERVAEPDGHQAAEIGRVKKLGAEVVVKYERIRRDVQKRYEALLDGAPIVPAWVQVLIEKKYVRLNDINGLAPYIWLRKPQQSIYQIWNDIFRIRYSLSFPEFCNDFVTPKGDPIYDKIQRTARSTSEKKPIPQGVLQKVNNAVQ